MLPLSAPGLLATAVLVFGVSLGFYVTPILLGGARSPFIASLIGEPEDLALEGPAWVS